MKLLHAILIATVLIAPIAAGCGGGNISKPKGKTTNDRQKRDGEGGDHNLQMPPKPEKGPDGEKIH